MLAPKDIPKEFQKWNKRWGAPFGYRGTWRIPMKYRFLPIISRVAGMFAFQPNSTTRAFEYPWAFAAGQLQPGLDILEIGGGLSGFQFVLSKNSMKVVNVDPGLKARGKGWPVDPQLVERLNINFGTNVILKHCFIDDAGLKDESFDRVFCISTLEHIPEPDIITIINSVRRVLKPGGLFALTIDLFLDLNPFTNVESNYQGRNILIPKLIEHSCMKPIHGKPEELYGFQEFNEQCILKNCESYLIGESYHVMVQTLVLQKSHSDVSF